MITPTTLTIGGVVAAGKIYDGTATASLSSVGTLTGLVGNQTLILTQSGATFADADVGPGKTVTVNGYAIADGTGLAGNYQLASSTATTTANIAAATLTAALTGTVSKTYDGTATATLGAGNYVLTGTVYGNDAVALNNPTSGLYADANAGIAKTVGVSGLTLDNANYVLAAPTASAAIGTIQRGDLDRRPDRHGLEDLRRHQYSDPGRRATTR